MLKIEQQGKRVTIPNIRNQKRTQVLLDGMDNVSQSKSVDSIVKEGIKTLKLILDADIGDLLLVDRQSGAFNRAKPYKAEIEHTAEWAWDVQKEIAQWVLDSEQIYCTNRSYSKQKDKPSKNTASPFHNVLCFPLKINDEPVGVIQAANRKEKSAFKKEDIADLELFAKHLAFAIRTKENQQEIEGQLDEKNLLMTEIHHRLKNNLSTVTSLIEMELPKVRDEASIEVLKQTCSRIKSITEVHSLLYQVGGSDDIELLTYFRQLSGQIADTISGNFKKVEVSVQGDAVKIDSDRTMTCGLILNELIVNAYKHAFDDVKEGRITINILENKDKTIRITISDNGKGIGDDFSLDKGKSMGCWVIKALADRLDASIDIKSKDGTRYALTFDR